LPHELFQDFDWTTAHTLPFDMQVRILMLTIAIFFGWRASSIFHLEVANLSLNPTYVQVVQGVAKNWDRRKPRAVGRLSFPQLPELDLRSIIKRI
jgi:hypothetical protein